MVLGSFAVISVVGGRGDAAHSLDDYRGLNRRAPVLAVLFTLFLLAQAGIPATSGFMAKFGVIRAAAGAHSYAIAIIAMFASVVGAFAYLRVIVAMFMSDDAAPAGDGAMAVPNGTRIALVVAVAATLFLGIAPQLLVNFADQALLR
jgi:NADH-quinone oxidoreductase subunit N